MSERAYKLGMVATWLTAAAAFFAIGSTAATSAGNGAALLALLVMIFS